MMTLRGPIRILTLALVLGGLGFASPASAQEPTAADAETALTLFKEGKALRDKGDLAGALEKLRAAYALVATPLTALELGKTYAAEGKLLEAREVLLTVPRIPVRANESSRATEARAESESLAAQLRPRLASVVVRPRGLAPGQPLPRVLVDGVSVPPEAATVPRVLNPGAHVIVLDLNGQRSQSDVTLAEGEARTVDVDLPPPPPVELAPPISGAEGPPPAPARKIHPLVYVGFGTAGAGLLVGGITGAMTLSKAGTIKDACTADGRCPPSSQDDLDSASTTGTVSTVSFVLALAGAAVGVVGVVLTSSPRAAAKTGLRVVPTPAGVAGTF